MDDLEDRNLVMNTLDELNEIKDLARCMQAMLEEFVVIYSAQFMVLRCYYLGRSYLYWMILLIIYYYLIKVRSFWNWYTTLKVKVKSNETI